MNHKKHIADISAEVVNHYYNEFLGLYGERVRDSFERRFHATSMGYMRIREDAAMKATEHLRRNDFSDIRDDVFEAIDDMIREGSSEGRELRRVALCAINNAIDACGQDFADTIRDSRQ